LKPQSCDIALLRLTSSGNANEFLCGGKEGKKGRESKAGSDVFMKEEHMAGKRPHANKVKFLLDWFLR